MWSLTYLEGDYAAGPYDVTFRAGNMNVQFNVPLVNDNIYEANEDFTLTILPPESILVGNNRQTAVTIVDDDGEHKFYLQILVMYIVIALGSQL